MDKTEKALQRINRGIVLAVESDDKEAIEDLKVTKQALEKQVPKKIEGKSVTYESSVGNCPCCGSFIRRVDNRKVCDCGQKIDWGDEQ